MSDAIEAARIAANAAIRAARIQGEWTLGAGLVAFGGGFLALAGALIAAGIQVRVERKKYNDRVTAYSFRMRQVAVKLCDMQLFNRFHLEGDQDIVRIEPTPFVIPDELSPSHWEDHAMLGEEAVIAISDLYEMVTVFDEFAREMHDKPADAQSSLGVPRTDDNEVTESAIETYRRVHQALMQRGRKLLVVLRKPPLGADTSYNKRGFRPSIKRILTPPGIVRFSM